MEIVLRNFVNGPLYNYHMAGTKRVFHEGQLVAVGNVDPVGLPENYSSELRVALQANSYAKPLPIGKKAHPNNRDHDYELKELATIVAAGVDLCASVPWLWDWYLNGLAELVREILRVEPVPLSDQNEAMNGLVFGPGMRIEAHTDVWAVNPNLYVKNSANLDDGLGGTYIGSPSAVSHSEILQNPIDIVRAGEGKMTFLACEKYPHTVGRPSSPENFVAPDTSKPAFWNHPETRLSVNFSYTTAEQLSRLPNLAKKDRTVGFSRYVL